ncbi:energy transducer TonB [Olivibacter ginsenosidimutans]|uniref:Energy transducer TonB n=1 Tax=Olivibacter ginsenosidimutans TaxID=1176537 RepID=A0ABP9ANX2_9SPHI
MSKLDIFKPEWLDVVFAGRNKAYGAYDLRSISPKYTSRALLIGILLFVGLISSPMIIKALRGDQVEEAPKVIETEVTLSEPPPVNEEEPPPPPPVEPPPPRVDQVRMPPPKVVPAEQVREEEPPTVEELKKADPGPKTIAGDPTADIRIDMPVGEGPKDAQVTEEGSGIMDFSAVEVQPTFPGGMQAFYKWVSQNYRYPEMAKEQGVNGSIHVSFVVERDGSLTDIKVIRDLKYGTGDEAVRMLKSSPKWKPGIQNGRPVRVSYSLPIKLNLQGM